MESRCKDQGKPQAKWIRQLVSQGERREASLQGLVRIAQKPQHPGYLAQAGHPGVCSPMERGKETVLLRVIEGTALLQMDAGEGKLPLPQQRASQRPVGFQQERGLLDTLSHAEELLSQLARRR